MPNEQELARTLFRDLTALPEYAVYCSQEDNSFEAERAFIAVLFREVVNRSAIIEQTLEEQDINWPVNRSEEHTFELQSLMRISYAVFCLKNNNTEII